MFKTFLIATLLIMSAGNVMANPMQPDTIGNVKPTNKPVVIKKTVRWPNLDDIIIIGDYRKAVFNRTTEVKLGDSISGYQLVRVEKDYVVLQRGNTTKRINLTTTGAVKITPAVEE